jgi:hypothetical protein
LTNLQISLRATLPSPGAISFFYKIPVSNISPSGTVPDIQGYSAEMEEFLHLTVKETADKTVFTD